MIMLLRWMSLCLFLFFNISISQIVLAQPGAHRDILVYSSIRPANYDIFLFKNKKIHRLTNNAALNYNPVASADGKWIIYTSEQTGIATLYAMRSQGHFAKPFRLIRGDYFQDQAVVSPDNATIYFVSTRDGRADIFKLPFTPGKLQDIQNAINLTHGKGSSFHPSVSPDGKLIAFSNNRLKREAPLVGERLPDDYMATDIYLMGSDGDNVKQLTTHSNWNGSPVWALDGQKIYFYSTRNKISQIYQIDKDGKNIKKIGPSNIYALSPKISLSGRLYFTARYENAWVIASSKIDGNDFRIETPKTRSFWAPAFNPKTGDMLSFGLGPINEPVFPIPEPPTPDIYPTEKNGTFFINVRDVRLPDRHLKVYAIRGYFPILDKVCKHVLTTQGFARIVVSDLNGLSMREIFKPKDNYVFGLSWSKDWKWITTAVGRPFGNINTPVNIYKLCYNSEKIVNLTKNTKNNAFPRFMLDGTHIIFRGIQDSYKHLYLIDSDGGNLKQLTFNKS